jgi:D-inositol-3-phosphate glycosyltransferase
VRGPRIARRAPAPVGRVAVLSLHTSPLVQPGTGDGGGLNVHVLETGRRLADRGVQVDVFTRASAPRQSPTVHVHPGLAVHHVEAGPRAPVPKEALPGLLDHLVGAVGSHVRDRLGGRSYDLLHAHYWLSGIAGSALAEQWGTPLVMSFHTLGAVKNESLAPGDEPEPAIRLAGEERLLDEADRIAVSICGEARDLHRRYGVSGERLVVVPPGVDPRTFRPVDGVTSRAGGTDPLLLFVGRLQPLKGPDVAVRTLAEVRRRFPAARLLVVGGVSGRNGSRTGPGELRRLADELDVADAVDFAPAQPQETLADLYREADLVLVPSRTESFGLVALEAQACGTPVVAANVGGLREIVRGGRLVDGHGPSDHAEAVVALLADRAAHRSAAASALAAAEGVTWDRTVDRMLAVYSEVTARAEQRVGA